MTVTKPSFDTGHILDYIGRKFGSIVEVRRSVD